MMMARLPFSYLSCAYFYLLVGLALFHLCLSNQNLDNKLCMEDERQALLEFKHGLIDEGDRLASWVAEESDCCRWAGIVCDNITRHVHQVHLPGFDGHCLIGDFRTFKKYNEAGIFRTFKKYNEASKLRLRGNLSSSLLRLKQLRHLDISCNNFEGIRIPSFIGSLSNLRYLNLSNSKFGGIIPPQLGNLSHLEVLCLGSFRETRYSESTRMSNMQWLSSLRMLKYVDMSNVYLSDVTDWLHVINTLPSLVELHLSESRLWHKDPNAVSLNFTSLYVLDLSRNYFGDFVPPWIFSVTSLVSLDLSGCGFESLTPGSKDGFHNLTSLESLNVHQNGFMNSSLVLEGLSSNLISLDVSACGISSPVLDSLHNLTSLRSLDLSQNELTKTIPKSLGNLCNLRDLYISDMKSLNISLMHLLDSFFECKSPSLESLFLSYLGLFGHLPDQVGRLVHLRHLELEFNQISGIVPDSIGRLSSLRTLSLAQNQINGSIPLSITKLLSLEVLDLKQNRLEGILPESIGRLSLLEMLDISYNRLTGSIPDSLGSLSKLHYLDLSNNFLNGPIPNSVGRLSSILWLDLSNNQFVRSLPNSIGQLSSLECLYLSNNHLDGSLPESIGRLSLLDTLDISNNRLNGSIPDSLGTLSKLLHLDLSKNLLTGPIPNSVGGLSSISWLDFSNNQFVRSFPNGLGHLQNLRVLYVHNNLLNGSVSEHHFSVALREIRAENNRLSLHLGTDNWVPPFQLEVLRIGSWSLGPHFPSWIQSQIGLKDLDISNTGISGTVPSWFWITFRDIRFLNMSHNDMKGNLIGDLISVYVPNAVVDLSSNHFEGPLPAKFNEVDLLSLDVSNNHLSGSLDQFLCYNSIMNRALQVLDLANNNLSGAIPDCWLNWGSLLALNFENNGLSGEIPQSFGNLSDLQSINIRNNKLSGKIPASLLNLNRLQILELSENEFTGSIPLSIGREETKLKLLSLRSNNLEGAIPDELCGLTQIQILDLAHNSLSGTLPTCFYNFSAMSEKQNMSVIEQSHGSALMAPTERGSESFIYVFDLKVQIVSLVTKGSEYEYSTNLFLVTALDLSGNKFSGPIPKELMSLVGLRYVNLSGNHLTGRIPEEIGKMTSLESLDMSVNRLDGKIPRSISGLSLINSLNMSFNKLTGEIPTSTQLQSLNESSFMGNALCGPPLAEQCSKKRAPPDAESTRDLSSDGQNWGLIISIVLGFTIGFWAVIAPIIASKAWRSVYFYSLYKAWYKIRVVCCSNRHG